MDIDKKLDLLKNIQSVDEPPFLLTRIRQRIQSLNCRLLPGVGNGRWHWPERLYLYLIWGSFSKQPIPLKNPV